MHDLSEKINKERIVLHDLSFKEIQREYFKRIILQYVEAQTNEEEKSEMKEALYKLNEQGQEGLDEVIERMLNDDALWAQIDTSIDYYIRLLF